MSRQVSHRLRDRGQPAAVRCGGHCTRRQCGVGQPPNDTTAHPINKTAAAVPTTISSAYSGAEGDILKFSLIAGGLSPVVVQTVVQGGERLRRKAEQSPQTRILYGFSDP